MNRGSEKITSIPKQFNGKIPKFVAAPCANGNGFQLIDTSGLDQATLSLLAKNLSGKVLTIDAKQAKEWGLINEFVRAEGLDDYVNKLSEELASLAPGTMSFGLEAYEKQDSLAFDEALPFLQKQIAKTFEGPDAKEGIAAFLEKRKPNWD